ncbi:MAG: hypothetical protein RL664_1154 [Bacteroidota bacterium]
MKKVLFSLSLLFAVVFTSCTGESAGDVNQDRIYTEYEQFYNSNTGTTTVIARFRFGGALGTILELDSTDNVKFNGDDLPYSIFWGAHVREYVGNIAPGTFVYTNLDGNVFTNTVPTFETIDFPSNFTELSRSTPYDFQWTGTAIGQNQEVGVFVGSWAWGDDTWNFTNSVGATNMVFGINSLSNLPLGTSTVYLDRTTRKTNIQGTSRGGVIKGKFRAPNRVINVIN